MEDPARPQDETGALDLEGLRRREFTEFLARHPHPARGGERVARIEDRIALRGTKVISITPS